MLAVARNMLVLPLVLGRRPGRQRVLAVMAIAAIVVCGAFLVPGKTWQRIFRLGKEVTAGTMTHRTVIWGASVEVFPDHAFVGAGAGAPPPPVVEHKNRSPGA